MLLTDSKLWSTAFYYAQLLNTFLSNNAKKTESLVWRRESFAKMYSCNMISRIQTPNATESNYNFLWQSFSASSHRAQQHSSSALPIQKWKGRPSILSNLSRAHHQRLSWNACIKCVVESSKGKDLICIEGDRAAGRLKTIAALLGEMPPTHWVRYSSFLSVGITCNFQLEVLCW